MGLLYENGQGVPQNYSKAKELYEIASELGIPTGILKKKYYFIYFYYHNKKIAMINLGYLYEKGRGTEQNWEKSKELYEEAAALGNSTGNVFLYCF